MRFLRSIGHYFRHTDLYLFFLALCCSGFGAVLVFSATRTMGTNQYIIIQLSAVVLGLLVFILMSLFDLEDMSRYWKWFLLLNIGLQLLLYPFGYGEGGNHSWLRFGPIGIQPGEVGKVLFIFTFAAHLEREHDRLNHWRTLLGLGLHLVIIMGAVVVPSSDLGVGISYLFVFIVMLFGAGLSLKWFAGGAVAALASVPFIWQLFSGENNIYRLKRILVLFDPSIAPDIAWHTEKSKIAIGAGEVFGAGLLQGNQMQHSHFPGKHTDFIFAVAGEEFGLVGGLVILILLCLLILRLFYVSYTANSTFSAVLTIGIAGMFLSQTFENILMCLGMFPVVGITLPLFSYGGSSVITMYAALGIAAGVRMREKPSWLKR